MRVSMYKQSILSILSKSHLLSLSDIQKKLPDADFSTIFRNIEQLCTNGTVRKIMVSKDLMLYEVANNNSHDHFVCNDCGIIESIELKKNRIISNHIVTDVLVRGICDNCIK